MRLRALVYVSAPSFDDIIRPGRTGDVAGEWSYQHHRCLQRAAELGLDVINDVEDEYVDHGESAENLRRARLQACLRRLRRHRDASIVLIDRQEILAANEHDEAHLFDAFEDAGATVVYVNDADNTDPRTKYALSVLEQLKRQAQRRAA
jgi:resolvase-like protein